MSIYMKADGIIGGVTSIGYAGMTEVSEVAFDGISNGANTVVGQDSDRITRRPHVGKVRLVKSADKSSHHFFQAAHKGTVIDSIELYYVTAGNPPFTYQKIKLTNPIVSHYSSEHNNESQTATEYITLDYTAIEQTFIPRDEKNNPQSPLISGYDLPTAKSL